MSSLEATRALRKLSRGFGKLGLCDPLAQCLVPRFARSMATEAPLPTVALDSHGSAAPPSSGTFSADSAMSPTRSPISPPQVLTTIYSWPTLEPLRFENYSAHHLHLPLRRDILHRAVIYEGDMTRQGTASTKWRKDVHGSGKKVLPQKGTGRARAGDKKSPIRKGGGVAFGPHPRDFSTGLPRKVYDLAWRTALSYRYRRGELIILDNNMTIKQDVGPRLLSNIFEGNQWGSSCGRSTLVTKAYRPFLFEGMVELKRHGIVKDMFDLDVKDLLTTGRIVIEKQALDTILLAHTSDMGPKHSMIHAAQLIAWARKAAGIAEEVEEAEEATEEDYVGEAGDLNPHAAEEVVENHKTDESERTRV